MGDDAKNLLKSEILVKKNFYKVMTQNALRFKK